MYEYDYGYGYDYGQAAALGTASTIITLLVAVFSIACMWKIFTKAGKPGWAAIVPFYNLYVLFEITWGSGIKFLLLLIPIANIIIMIMTYVKLAKVFGKSGGFAVGMLLLPIVFMPILAFGSARYVGIPSPYAPGYPPQPGYPQPGYPPQPQAPYAPQQPPYQPQAPYAPPQQPAYQQPQAPYTPPQPAPVPPVFAPAPQAAPQATPWQPEAPAP
ncbi:MAG TPA: DUF5684 domain-containing protein, partial [Clostridia bacterium]|nr:DUF5684 domain-containing protein [Clostridia bacterium]